MALSSSVELRIKVKPGSRRNELIIDGSSQIVVKVTAPPIEGAANEAVILFLSQTLKVGKSSITLVKGHTNPFKTLRINGLTWEEFKEKIGLP